MNDIPVRQGIILVPLVEYTRVGPRHIAQAIELGVRDYHDDMQKGFLAQTATCGCCNGDHWVEGCVGLTNLNTLGVLFFIVSTLLSTSKDKFQLILSIVQQANSQIGVVVRCAVHR